jgi:periplasmic divalent cation tolerance protein
MTERNPSDKIVVFITAPKGDAGPTLARTLVEDRLAACVNILPDIRSIYAWEGEICDDGEVLMVVKTRAALFERLRKFVVDAHPYDVPEVIALPLAEGHPAYLEWVEEMTVAPN